MTQPVASVLSPAEMEARIAALEAQLASLEICETCGGLPCGNPHFCELCSPANRKGTPRHHLERHRRRLADDVALQPKGVARSTVEALMYSLRRGVNELTHPDTLRRLSAIDNAQLKAVCRRLQNFKPEIATPWSSEKVAALIAKWKKLHG